MEGSWKAWLSEGAGVTWKKIKPHTEGTETRSFSEHRGELTLAERAQSSQEGMEGKRGQKESGRKAH